MDALDIITDLENVFPYFQAIFNADEHRIIGYEIFGRYRSSEGIISIGSFFEDEQVPEEYRILVDNEVLRKALQLSLDLDDDVLLFINRNAKLLLHDDDESFLNLLIEYEKLGVKMARYILEISGGLDQGDIDHLDHLLTYYRTYGMKIAMDKIGNDQNGQLERIGQIAPDIIKVDLKALKSTETSRAFQDVLFTLSMLARKIGATLLFENIEMVYQLQFAWKNGGRFYQGYYLQKPSEQFVDRSILKSRLREEIHEFITYEKKNLVSLIEMRNLLQAKLQLVLAKNKKTDSYDDWLMNFSKEFDDIAFRLYVCDEDGFQKSANIFKEKNSWVLQEDYINKNWSWRPFFLENIIYMMKEQKGILSDLYSDIEIGELIRTFSYPLNESDFLFIDISYDYLYEQLKF
ncbi:EAL-associated domain-containing protein [Bacillus sp. CGMCC 1.16607]|uniref:EAL domain-containing protein n=1 Tax=Bacillus sp. CGMCC 1.16607 TaxID=3351842 RepID=UPI0036294C09